MTPIESSAVQPQDKSWMRPQPLDGGHGTFLDVADPAIVLTAWKNAEDGDGTILRFLDLGGAPRSVTVNVPLVRLSAVVRTDAVERDLGALPKSGEHGFSFPITPHEIVTVRLRGAPVHPPRDPGNMKNGDGLHSLFGLVPAAVPTFAKVGE